MRPTLDELLLDELRARHTLPLCLLLHHVREEESPQDSEHDEELNTNDEPKLTAHRG